MQIQAKIPSFDNFRNPFYRAKMIELQPIVLLKEVDAKILNKNSVKKTHLKIKMMYLD